MNFIKKIFEDKADDLTHRIFSRFGKGDYDNRGLIEIKTGSKINIKTSFEFSNYLFNLVSNLIDKGEVKGKIISDEDFEKELDFENNYSKRGKMYTAELDLELDSNKMKEIYEKFKLKNILLSVNSDKVKLICKTSLPKPGGVLKNNFCKLSCDKGFKEIILKEFAFDVKDFKKLNITHEFIIDDLIIPEEYENDFKKARHYAKRKGKIIRNINLDGKEICKEKKIEV